VHVHWTAYGSAAYDALRSVLADVKRNDPLAPTTLIVPSNLTGTIARRTLATTTTAHGTGIAGLTVLTVDRLAELLASPALTADGRRPATGPVLSTAWRGALRDAPGLFAEVAGHPATVRALVETHRTLRDLSAQAREAIVAEGGQLPREVTRLHEDVVANLRDDFYDAADLRDVAHEMVTARAADLGTVVVFLPQDLDRRGARLLASVGSVAPAHVVAALSGEPRADVGVLRTLAALGVSTAAPDLPPPTASRIFHASDSDEEVRGVVRDVVRALATVPAHRIAVLYGSTAPYARLLHEQLGAAGIALNGPGVRPAVQSVIPRAFLGMLGLAADGITRSALFRLLSAVTVRDHGGGPVPASRWERISRSAGVVGEADWIPRLGRYASEERQRAGEEAAQDAPRQGLIDRCISNADSAEALRRFVDDLAIRCDLGRRAAGWSELATWGLNTLHELLWTPDRARRLPEEEHRAAEQVERALDGLRGLDALEPGADLTALRDVVELQLADAIARSGRFGTGVLVAPLSAAMGLTVDQLFVVGLAEGLCPPRVREDALLPEAARRAASDELPPVRDRLDRQHRQLLAAFAAAPMVTAAFPRGDLRRSGDRLPSRWLLPSMRALSGEPQLTASRWQDYAGDWLSGSPSNASSVVSTPWAATSQDWRLRALMTAAPDIPADPALQAARSLISARDSSQFTRFDGNLSAEAGFLPDPADGQRISSPTSLESWVSCPHAYLVRRLLFVEPVEQPEELLQISPADRGSLLHRALEEFFSEVNAAGHVPTPDAKWTAEDRRLLRRIGERVADEYESKGVSGHPTLWQRERLLVMNDLDLFLEIDERRRSAEQRTQVASELRFGNPPVGVTLPDGRTMRLRGSADRVDECDDGTLVVVDYKSGSVGGFKGLSEQNPDLNGSKLQLPVYAYAARQRSGDPETPVRASYWFIGPKNRGAVVELPLTPAVEKRYREVLTVIADGIAGGLFPARAPEDAPWLTWIPCPYCDPDGLGAKDRRVQWQRKRSDPALAAYLDLVEPDHAPVAP
jgi:ATP-dependent helicase/nuclease subunit B